MIGLIYQKTDSTDAIFPSGPSALHPVAGGRKVSTIIGANARLEIRTCVNAGIQMAADSAMKPGETILRHVGRVPMTLVPISKGEGIDGYTISPKLTK